MIMRCGRMPLDLGVELFASSVYNVVLRFVGVVLVSLCIEICKDAIEPDQSNAPAENLY